MLLALAQPGAAHDMGSGAHGGQVVDVKGHHVEFTVKDTVITVYLTDDKDGPIASAGAQAKALVQDAGKSASISLAPAEPNLLTGTLTEPLSAGARSSLLGNWPMDMKSSPASSRSNHPNCTSMSREHNYA